MKPQPTGLYTEDAIESGGMHHTTFLSYPKYHRHEDGTLHETDCVIRDSQDPDWDWEVIEGVWTLYVKRDGTYQSRFHDYTITRKPVGVGFCNTHSKKCVVKIDFDLNSWVVKIDGDTATWTNPDNGIVFKVQYIHDQARGIVELPQAVQTQLLEDCGSWPVEDTSVCVIYDADIDFLSEDVDTVDSIIDGNSKWVVKVGGLYVVHEKHGLVSKEHRDNLAWQKHTIYLPEQKRYIEACALDALKSEDGVLIFNDTDTFKEGVDGYSGCEDTYIELSSETTHGSSTQIYCDGDSWDTKKVLIKFDLSGEIPLVPHQTITSASLGLYVLNHFDGPADSLRIMCAGVLKP